MTRISVFAGGMSTPPGAVDLETARLYVEQGVDRLGLQPQTMDGTDIDRLIDHVGENLADVV